MLEIARRPDPIQNYQLYRQRAARDRGAYLRGAVSSSLPSVSPKAKRGLGIFATAFAVATGAFWGTMLTSPPVSEAAHPGVFIHDLHLRAPLNLPVTQADAF